MFFFASKMMQEVYASNLENQYGSLKWFFHLYQKTGHICYFIVFLVTPIIVVEHEILLSHLFFVYDFMHNIFSGAKNILGYNVSMLLGFYG